MACFVAIASLTAIPVFAQSAGELLQKGIYTQETAGDLDGAIAIYRQIVNSGNSPRDIAAQAQYRLAQSLLQKGDLANGATEFSNLARNYADYGKLIGNLATQARGSETEQRLADLIKFEQLRLQTADAVRGARATAPAEKTLLDQALNSIDRGDYQGARLALNTLINTWPNSIICVGPSSPSSTAGCAKGTRGVAQAEAELRDFTLFYPNWVTPGAGRQRRRGSWHRS